MFLTITNARAIGGNGDILSGDVPEIAEKEHFQLGLKNHRSSNAIDAKVDLENE